MKEKLLLLGFGDISERLADQMFNEYSITGVRRSQKLYPNIEMLAADVTDKIQLAAVFQEKYDVIVITMTPAEISDEGYQRAYIASVKALLSAFEGVQWRPRLIVFVSSTSVYGQSRGEWVDEQTPAEPTSFSGQRLLEAEQLLVNSDLPVCVVRFSGIYGPGRERLIQQVRSGQGTATEPPLFSNRIHADDAAGVLGFLINRQKNQAIDSVYLATDCEPVPLHEVKNTLADMLGVDKKSLVPKPVNRQMRSNKRVSNRKLLELGYTFKYPTFREGYRSVLDKLLR